MKHLIVLILFIFNFSLAYSNINLTNKLIASVQWYGYYTEVIFNENKSLIIKDRFGEGMGYNEGNYEINNNKIIIEYELILNKSSYVNGTPKYHKIRSEYLFNTNNQEHTYVLDNLIRIKYDVLAGEKKELSSHLYCMEKIFSEEPSTGSQKIIAGKTIQIFSNPIEAVTTSNLKLRSFPSTDSRYYYFQDNGNLFPYIPENKKILIIAKTTEKFKIDNWNNYWYYINITSYDGPGAEAVTKTDKLIGEWNLDWWVFSDGFWVYGEFIKEEKHF